MPGNWRRFKGFFSLNGTNGTNGANSRHAWLHEEERALLPHHRNQSIESAIPPREVTKVCLRLRHLIRECIPCELEESQITRSHSTIITNKVIQAAREAGGERYGSCVVYALLVNMRWFQREAIVELWDADLHDLRAVACTVIAKQIIENEDDAEYLLHHVLLRRYSFLINQEATAPTNVIEKAVDLHAVRVIGSSGYQKCIAYLWRGWLVQDENDPSKFVDYKDKDNINFIVHMDPDRMRAPRYQNAAQLLFSIIYLGLYTIAINSINATGVLDAAEIVLYIFTFAYVADELVKYYKAGYHILGFWNVFNFILYTFLTVSLVFRIIGLSYWSDDKHHAEYNRLSYYLLAFVAPMFWGRLLLYCDSFRFFGAMLVVLKVMMKESVIFFALLIIIIIGFLQAFIGLDVAEDNVAGDSWFIIEAMLKAIMQSPEFDGFENFGHPYSFGLVLYYCFTFIVMIILLNILIALYNSAYEDIYENADDEYLALFAQKTMQFVRAPDENVYIAPFNLVEIIISGLFEWWMPKSTYEFINDCVMAVLYSPLLFVAAWFETRTAHNIRHNRARGEEDDDQVHEWEQFHEEMDFEAEGWTKTCDAAKPNVEEEPAVIEVRKLRAEVDELKQMLSNLGSAIKGKEDQPVEEAKSGKAPETEGEETLETSEVPETSDVAEHPDEHEQGDAPEAQDAPEASAASGDNKGGKKNKKKNKKKGPGGAGPSSGGPSS
ncbi:Calcium channel yvc1 [Fusarium falciforme]|uniref:Calcium channel yvc1 n=1 Tax=Fusarium falciforme TaxID=195108 RepID=A0A9W8RG78_9HYPO|nr:Calcium channel yvc1 [Fusarium falciforme]KAJ4208758.1 Calcium channel yvc1 [Fusarium falciforme]KAJ4238455.1 Calcium channel yvc1 [Fusarium falciforme]